RGEPKVTTKRSRLQFVRSLHLPFCPRNLAWVRGGTKLIVTDAFGGRLAVVDARSGSLQSVRSLPAHNIRGLATSPDGGSLVLAHQSLDGPAHATRENVHWGMLIGNHLRVIRVDHLLAAGNDSELHEWSRLIRLGNDSDGAGDPTEVALLPDGGLVVALGG